ncbi:SMI1/KNR4 family protein [Viridibacillus sp. YIM B01967]|uniref:SMI1/KNR4 family protein n=1 Tax=Viridibacillus soli TaxID=2798301 RepID=A0ABS1H486_9BACL|nr:SMI1/KNR4 family protein [Viridibacillus soli]MBK3494230.1 SMI1/KNR4 family protein [Viridibacillus soli]
MKLSPYEAAKKILLSEADIANFIGPQSSELLERVEDALNLKIIGSYREFLLTFGAGFFSGVKILGIPGDDFGNPSLLNGVSYTLTLRKEVGLPCNLLVIYNPGNGELFCLDFHQIKDDEPEIVSFMPEVGMGLQYDAIADSFGEFLYEIVCDEF